MPDRLRLNSPIKWSRWRLPCCLAVVASLALAGEASAGTVRPAHCGEVIVESIQLADDVGPCEGTDGLIVGRDNIVIDLNGHKIIGDAGPSPAPVDPVGIRIEDRSYVKVTNNPNDPSTRANAEITEFNAGVDRRWQEEPRQRDHA